MRFGFIRPGNMAQAITHRLPAPKQFARDVIPALQAAGSVERDRRRFGERS